MESLSLRCMNFRVDSQERRGAAESPAKPNRSPAPASIYPINDLWAQELGLVACQ